MPETATPVVDHVFRAQSEAATKARSAAWLRRSEKVDPGMCCYMGCNRPRGEHVSRADFEDRREPMPELFVVLEHQPDGTVIEDQSISVCDTADEALNMAEDLRIDALRDAESAGNRFVVYRLDVIHA